MVDQKSKRGFALLSPERRREIAAAGGRAQGKHNNPGNFANKRKEASEAGRKGGIIRGRRGHGTTTSQMRSAPVGAVFVWLHDNLAYPRDIAKKLSREDLLIVSPSWLTEGKWRGLELTGVILDHAVAVTDSIHNALQRARAQVRTS
jgi:general stress protein YciG